MLKSIGSLHTVPAPSAAVLGESLKLLATFGDKKDISKLLEQVRDVQTHNEQVFRDAQALMGDLNVQRNALDVSQREFSTKVAQEEAAIKRDRSVLVVQAAQLDSRVQKLNEEQGSSQAKLEEQEKHLADLERSIVARDLKFVQQMQDFNLRVTTHDKKEKELSDRFTQLFEKERKLRAALDGG